MGNPPQKFQFWNGTAKEIWKENHFDHGSLWRLPLCSFLNWNFGEQRRYKKTKSRWKTYTSIHYSIIEPNSIPILSGDIFPRWQLSRLPRNFFDYYSFGSREQPCIRPFSIWVKNFPSGKIPIYSISGNNSNGCFFFGEPECIPGFPKMGFAARQGGGQPQNIVKR